MRKPKLPIVAVIFGSETDRGVMNEAVEVLVEAKVPHEVLMMSAHRNPEQVADFAKGAREAGLKIIIAGAGLAAALPGVIASYTDLPVIGVPLATGPLNGMDAMMSIIQMPKGVPVATVGINNAKNGALLALRILRIKK